MLTDFSKYSISYLLTGVLWFSLFMLSACTGTQNGQSIIINMPYHEARKIILKSGWNPVLGNTSEENIGIPAMIFRDKYDYIEVDDCTSTGIGYCTFYFQNEKGEYLRIETQGEDDGSGARLQARIIYAAIHDKMD